MFNYLSAEASVDVDPKNKKAAGIMLLSVVPFIMVTLSAIFDSHSRSHQIIILITLIISSSSTAVYFVYSVYMNPFKKTFLNHFGFVLLSHLYECFFLRVETRVQYLDRDNQEKSLDHVKFEIMSEVHELLEKFSPKNLIENGEINKESLKRFF